MVDCIEENYEYYLPQSIMSELNTSFEVKTKLSSETVSSSSPATEPSDTEDESLSHFWSKVSSECPFPQSKDPSSSKKINERPHC